MAKPVLSAPLEARPQAFALQAAFERVAHNRTTLPLAGARA